MALIDTHLTVKEFIAVGMSEEQAEAITRVVARIDNQVASKSDIKELKDKISTTRTVLEDKISKVDDKISGIEGKVAKIETSILWIQGLLFIILGLLLKPMLF